VTDAQSPRRIAVFGKRGHHRTEASIVRAARGLGHEVYFVDVARWRALGPLGPALLRWRLDAFDPDALIITRYAAELGEDQVRRLSRGRWAAAWYFDLPLTPEILLLGRATQRVFTTYRDTLPQYRAAGIPEAYWLPQGMDPLIDTPASGWPAEYACDASFIGSGPYPHRWPALQAVAKVCQLQVRGPGWDAAPRDIPVVGGEIRGEEFARATCAARISLGASFSAEQAASRYSASNRMWKVLGCGGFFLGEYVEGIEELAAEGVHCGWYRGPADAAAQARHWLEQPEERAKIAAAGRAHALAGHTYAHRVKLLLEGRGLEL
jgi:spore maturation protein CgeB